MSRPRSNSAIMTALVMAAKSQHIFFEEKKVSTVRITFVILVSADTTREHLQIFMQKTPWV
jgi:mannitol/fructose-specific phosphotransferase system IIA component (Ntr-type)